MHMLKRWMAFALALFSLGCCALAEVYEGTVAAMTTVTVTAEVAGTVAAVEAMAGRRVRSGETLVTLKGQKTFAGQDGTVSLLNAEVGDTVGGEVLQITPVERYTIYCTVDKAYQSAEMTLVHSGETLYIKCTADGTHRAVGVVTQIDGEEYRVLTIGGELYVGETVYLYRDEGFTTAQRVGIGTVVVTDPVSYTAEGEVTLLRVGAGDEVERGQLLYEVDGGAVEAPADGIVTSIACQAGDALEADQVVAEIVPEEALCVQIRVDESAVAQIRPGDEARLTPAGNEEEASIRGTVVETSRIAESGTYTVTILPETGEGLSLGMTVEARL